MQKKKGKICSGLGKEEAPHQGGGARLRRDSAERVEKRDEGRTIAIEKRGEYSFGKMGEQSEVATIRGFLVF